MVSIRWYLGCLKGQLGGAGLGLHTTNSEFWVALWTWRSPRPRQEAPAQAEAAIEADAGDPGDAMVQPRASNSP